MDRKPLLELSADELADWCQARGQLAYRSAQIRRWIFNRRSERFEQMTDLPKSLRDALDTEFSLLTGEVVAHRTAADGTEKLVLRFGEGEEIECVLMRERGRRTICLSTQVGCAMGCVFCASGLGGVVRNLTAGEIVEQMLRLQLLLGPEERLSHVVVMGMGEPLANLENLLRALQAATAKDGLAISERRITISTVGLPERIRALADRGGRYHLAVSLHAPNDELRSELVPVSRRLGIDSVLKAADYFFERTRRQVTFEYVLLGRVNDQPQHARALGNLLAGRKAHVNLIPFNRVAELPFRSPTTDDLGTFVRTLQQCGVSVKVRKRKGSRIDAACGQLRRQVQVAARS